MSEKSYNVNLPKTNFPMKANSFVREVEFQKNWDEQKIYEKSLERHKDSPKYVLHDGPPYLSSNKIHIGTAMNKILKDIVTKYKSLRGFYSPYVPGYDSHGLPIETAVLKNVKGGRSAFTAVELRKKCREFALSNLKGQEDNFRRLGIWGDWANPYITLDPKFESEQIKVFGKMAEAGYLYKGLKPVYWCVPCETALAEAEVEYHDHKSDSIYVRFKVGEKSKTKLPAFAKGDVYFVIWTTTPWTLPANLGIALNPQFEYSFVKTKDFDILVVASELKDRVLQDLEIESAEVLGTVSGKDLEHIECLHPFIDRKSLVVLGDHVTHEAGTGCVHTAPGHGLEDFEVGNKYKLGVLSPLTDRGVFTDEAGPFAGMRYDKANAEIITQLTNSKHLLKHSVYEHSYPHCWRCKKPVIYRATEQWFCSVDGFRKKALEAIDTVTWLPASGRNRIYNMIENRSDWCISRQRSWGVPIPVFYCEKCQTPLLNEKSTSKVAAIFAKEGSDSWWEHDAAYFLDEGTKCTQCGHGSFSKEKDIMDVWFDSGVTHKAVLDARHDLLKGSPCELYLEGSDQHRGWFQSSLLTSVAVSGVDPYKTVLTHGFVVDEHGRKLSKSLGNGIEPDEVIKQYGADVLRLWVASINYTDDVPIGKNMLAQLADVYRKIRNTARYMLGNLYDFDPKVDSVKKDDFSKLDAFILHKLQKVVTEVNKDFDSFEFFKFYQLLQNFCVVDLSSFYFDIVKDKLYTCAPKSVERRAIQTALYEILHVLVRILVPVTPHLAEDIWQHMPDTLRGSETSVLLTDFPQAQESYMNSDLEAFWKDIINVRDVVNKTLETARGQQKIGSSLEAQVLVKVEDNSVREKLQILNSELPGIFITSQAKVVDDLSAFTNNGHLAQFDAEGVSVVALKAEGDKCPRCWKFSTTLGKDASYVELCMPCGQALAAANL